MKILPLRRFEENGCDAHVNARMWPSHVLWALCPVPNSEAFSSSLPPPPKLAARCKLLELLPLTKFDRTCSPMSQPVLSDSGRENSITRIDWAATGRSHRPLLPQKSGTGPLGGEQRRRSDVGWVVFKGSSRAGVPALSAKFPSEWRAGLQEVFGHFLKQSSASNGITLALVKPRKLWRGRFYGVGPHLWKWQRTHAGMGRK